LAEKIPILKFSVTIDLTTCRTTYGAAAASDVARESNGDYGSTSRRRAGTGQLTGSMTDETRQHGHRTPWLCRDKLSGVTRRQIHGPKKSDDRLTTTNELTTNLPFSVATT